MQSLDWIQPNWPAPKNVASISTTRHGGISKGIYSNFNLGAHVDDDELCVKRNRQILREQLGIKHEPNWIDQQHGTNIVQLTTSNNATYQADATYTTEQDKVCVALTADCLPVLFSDQEGSCVAVAHAGWRGLLKGVLESTLSALPAPNNQILCWLGPAIGPKKFEVGEDLKDLFVSKDQIHGVAFKPSSTGKCLADIYQLAKNILINCGVENIYGGGCCTYSETDRFYSYRRDGNTGRMATMIWIKSFI